MLAAARRLDALIHATESSVTAGTDDRMCRCALGSLREPQLREFLRDRAIVGGRVPGASLAASFANAIAEASNFAPHGVPPVAAQRGGIASLEARALDELEFTWNALGGTPRRISGALYVQRTGTARDVAEAFLHDRWPPLRLLLGASVDDRLVYESEVILHERGIVVVTFRRELGGNSVLGNMAEVYVTDGKHPLGPGVVVELHTEWDRTIEVMPGPNDRIAESVARDEAGRAVSLDLAADDTAHAELQLRCISLEDGRRFCGPMWQVHALRLPLPERGVDRHDTVFVHARTGAFVQSFQDDRAVRGHLSVASNYPYETVDTFRNLPYSQLLATTDRGVVAFATDADGNYDVSGLASGIGLAHTATSPAAGLPYLLRVSSAGCGPPFETNPMPFEIAVGGSIAPAPNATTFQRTEYLAYHWANWYFGLLRSDAAGLVEFPSEYHFTGGPGGGGGSSPCDDARGIESTGIGGGDDTVPSTLNARQNFFHEMQHAVLRCTDTVGRACGRACTVNRPLHEDWEEGLGDFSAGLLGQYESFPADVVERRQVRYAGVGVPGDAVIYMNEIEGTPTSGALGCDPTAVGGHYNCAPSEACWRGADDRPRCMRRASSLRNCEDMFRDQPLGLLEFTRDGVAPGETGVGVCASIEYENGHIWWNLGMDLFHMGSYRDFYRAIMGGARNNACDREFTATSNNYHDVMSHFAGRYEVTRAFHNTSNQTFPWLDDTTDDIMHAEVIRLTRDTPLTFTRGGPTETPLRIDTSTDQDWFAIPAIPGETYRIEVTPAAGAVDLCLRAFEWQSGLAIAEATGCTDGMLTSALRSASLNVVGRAQNAIAIRVHSVVQTTGDYVLRVLALGDDHPDSLPLADWAQPLSDGLSGQARGTLFPGDVDVFRYDVLPGVTADLVFQVDGLTPQVDVFGGTLTAPPSGAALATGAGSATILGATAGRYYVVVSGSATATGPYNVLVRGGPVPRLAPPTYEDPLPLPAPWGGFVTSFTQEGRGAPGSGSWETCRRGSTCDWYYVDLNAAERMSITTSRVWDVNCNLEVAVYPPTEWPGFVQAGDVREPIAYDRGGSMEDNGAQLAFAARQSGRYRIAVRSTGTTGCPRYEMSVLHGRIDATFPNPR